MLGCHIKRMEGDMAGENGKIMPFRSTRMNDSVDLAAIIEANEQEMNFILPNEMFAVGGIYFAFRKSLVYFG